MKFSNRFTLALAEYMLIILILSGSAYIFYSAPGAAGLFTNADMIQLPVLFSDLKENLANLFGWNLSESQAPFYFPDMAIFAVIYFLVKQPILSMQVYGLIQFLLLFLAVRWLFHELGGKQGWVQTLFFSVGALLATVSFIGLMNNSPLRGIGFSFLLSCIHFGIYILSIACLAACLHYLQTRRISFLFFSLLAVFLGTLSDLLFILYFVIPFLIVCFIFGKSKTFEPSRVKWLAITIGVVSLVAYLLQNHKNNNHINLVKALFLPIQFLFDIYQVSTVPSTCFLLIFVIFPFLYILLGAIFPILALTYRYKRGENTSQEGRMGKFSLFASLNNFFRNPSQTIRWLCINVFVTASVLLTIAAVFATDKYEDLGGIRYLLPLTYCAVFVLLSLSLEFEQSLTRYSKIIKVAATGIIGVITVVFVSSVSAKPIEELFPAPNYVSCFKSLGSVAGLAEYWPSLPSILFSNRQVQIATVNKKGDPYYWNNNRYWYLDNWANPNQYPDFKFIFMQKLDVQAIKQKYGQPDRITPCDNSEIWFYNQPGFLYRRLMAGNFEPFERAMIWRGQTTIPAALLSGNTGITNGLERIAREKQDSSGFLMAEPALKLSKGRYLAKIEYLSNNASPSSANAKVSLVVYSSKEAERDLKSQSLPITQGKMRTIDIEFLVEQSSKIELRIFYEGKGDLAVSSITFKRTNI